MKKHLVVALAYDRLCTFEFGCTVELFALARPELGVDWYDFAVCAIEPGPIRAAGGITVQASYAPALLDLLRAAHARGARLCSICSGVFVLAAAGLLDGQRATTHWRYAERLAQRHPRIRVEPDLLYVDNGQVITAAGSAAGLDMLLHLVRRDYGARVGNMVAQRLVIAPHREGGQAQFVPRPVASNEGGRLSRLLDWLRGNLALPHTVAAMAERAAMSPRTLQRQFQQATGLGPVNWLIRERIALVKELLEAPEVPLAQVAERSGFGSMESLRHHFRRVAGTTPGAYRKRFGLGANG